MKWEFKKPNKPKKNIKVLWFNKKFLQKINYWKLPKIM